MRGEPAYIEIIERTKRESDDLDVIIPNEVRINGTTLLCPADEPVTVHQIDLRDSDVVQVTLTLFARRVVIGHEQVD